LSTLHISIGLTVIAVLCACVFVVLIIKSRKARGNERRRYAKINLLWNMAFTVFVCAQAIFSFRQSGNGTLGLMIMLPLLVLALACGVFGLRSLRSDKYFGKLYELDPGFCGRCGYNLTGNTSGVCPECGWKLPERKEA